MIPKWYQCAAQSRLSGHPEDVVEVAGTHRAFELPDDPSRIVVRAGHVEGFAVPAEADGTGPLPEAEMTSRRGEIGLRGGFKAQAAGVLHGAEHQLLCQLKRGRERAFPEHREEVVHDPRQLRPVHDLRPEVVLDPEAVDVD